jgi:hypothetical protein
MMASHAKTFRLTIAGLMTIVVFVAIGMVALRAQTEFWPSCLFTFVVFMLSTSTVYLTVARGLARSRWAGMAIFGWIYFVIGFGPWPDSTCTPPPLLPLYALMYVQNYIFSDGKTAYISARTLPIPSERLHEMVIPSPSATPPQGVIPPTFDLDRYDQVSQLIGVILFGFLGAVVGRFMAARGARTETDRVMT